ncbi:MAG: pyruvate formate lyase-activating protein [Ruminococcaceae bacterium]|nr:pyruvate formate lyase-activating protein [Oscillospiraceae bacterium]
MTGYVHSLQSLGTVDGPGVRAVLFTEGCPLRCAYCHNPDTWEINEQDAVQATEIADKILRLYPYIKNGGVTFSGGEPCVQADFLCEVATLLKERDLHIALDTSGAVYNDGVEHLLSLVDLVLLDVKMTTEQDYKQYMGGSLEKTLDFLKVLDKKGIPVWIRHVVVPGINDTEESVKKLCELVSPFSCVEKIELLPFRTLCIEKYRSLGIPFPLEGTPQMSGERIQHLKSILQNN